MKKVLFLIHDLGRGGAEKVLVNLVNHLDRSKFEVTVIVLFGGGVNEQYLAPDIRFHAVFHTMIPGNSKWMKLLSPETLHQICVKERYDIEISYLEGPSARIVSGCKNPRTKKIAWIHSNIKDEKQLAASFRDINEARRCYERFDRIICVSKQIQTNMQRLFPDRKNINVLYNVNDSQQIRTLAAGARRASKDETIRMISFGSLKPVKRYDRLLRIVNRLKREGFQVHLDILGEGPLKQKLQQYIRENDLKEQVSLLGYQTNPYRFLAESDLYVCSSQSEGFSTAVTEALILGVPVCSVEVSGMKELLGDDNEYGLVTENSTKALYRGIRYLLENPRILEYYRVAAELRGTAFQTEQTVDAVEEMLERMIKYDD